MKKYNYILIGAGASGKTTFYNKQEKQVVKLDKLSNDDDFFAKPVGAYSYCSVNYSLKLLVKRIKNRPIKVIVCFCDKKTLRRRLTDRLYKRIKKYKNDDHFRKAMGIFVKNYTYDYSKMYSFLEKNDIPYEVVE